MELPKFKAWNKVDKEMWTMPPLVSLFELERFFGLIPDNAIILQFTGLKDKNGVEIYVGDVLRYDRSKMLAVVEFTSSGCYMFKVSTPKGDRWYNMRSAQEEYAPEEPCTHHTVIGNKFENPELVEVE